MLCDHLLSIQRRIRTARASAIDGQCTAARRLMSRADRDLARVKANATSATPCMRALAEGTTEFLTESRRLLRAQCPLGGH